MKTYENHPENSGETMKPLFCPGSFRRRGCRPGKQCWRLSNSEGSELRFSLFFFLKMFLRIIVDIRGKRWFMRASWCYYDLSILGWCRFCRGITFSMFLASRACMHKYSSFFKHVQTFAFEYVDVPLNMCWISALKSDWLTISQTWQLFANSPQRLTTAYFLVARAF